ncbi:hypothetical protein N9060_00980 [Arenicella sp.]|nr:hypothetical protein [Arenicella sp.]
MNIQQYRKSLVPLWIKIFGWIFILMSAAIPIMWIVYPFLELSSPAQFEMFGLRAVGSPFYWGALIIEGLIIANGISAFGLLFGMGWGVTACLINGYVGLAICIFTMVISGFSTIRLEPLIQVPYLMKLHSLKKKWYEYPASI